MRRRKSCNAWAITKDSEGDEIFVTKFGSQAHSLDHDETEAEEVMKKIKRKVEDDPAACPSGIIRDELRDIPSEFLRRLPERQIRKKTCEESGVLSCLQIQKELWI